MVPHDRLWSVAAAVGIVLASHATAAVTKIPYDVVTATTALSRSQQQAIEAFLDDKIHQLTHGNPDEVIQARRALVEPLTWAGGTEIFNLAYSSAATNRLDEAIRSDKLEVRLNAMILINTLNDPGVVNMIQIGLTDPNPAIRYWAGKAVNRTITGRLSEIEQRGLLDALNKAMLSEKSHRVLERLLLGMVGLTIPEAANQLLDGLNKRVSLHAMNPNTPMGASLEGLRSQFVKTVQGQANSQQIPVDTIRQMALVAYRYLDLSAALLDTDRIRSENRSHYREMIKLTDGILQWTARQMPPQSAVVPATIKGDIVAENWALIRLRAEEWKRTLTQAPFGFGLVDLMVTLSDGASDTTEDTQNEPDIDL